MAYTSRQCFEGTLTELSKVKGPSLLLEDFNYFFNKAINLWTNKEYNKYDVNQQTSDNLRVLKASAILVPHEVKTNISYDGQVIDLKNWGAGKSKLFNGTYEVELPLDYLHMLNCVCVYDLLKRDKCYDKGNQVAFAAKRLTADAWSTIMNDYYNRPLPKRPYYYIHNVNLDSSSVVTNEYNESILGSTDLVSNKANLDNNINNILYNLGYKWYVIVTVDNSSSSSSGPSISSRTQYILASKVANYTGTTGVGETIYKNLDVLNNLDYSVVYSGNTSLSISSKLSSYSYLYLNGSEEGIKCTPGTPKNINSVQFENIEYPRSFSLNDLTEVDVVDRLAYTRTPNPVPVRCEIRYGRDNSVYNLIAVMIDYIKAPQTIRLTQEQIDLTEDTSQIMEFPDYVCLEIINELVHLIMELNADPRIQTHQQVTQSIALPTQQLAQS